VTKGKEIVLTSEEKIMLAVVQVSGSPPPFGVNVTGVYPAQEEAIRSAVETILADYPDLEPREIVQELENDGWFLTPDQVQAIYIKEVPG
jgi:hypothetical protein